MSSNSQEWPPHERIEALAQAADRYQADNRSLDELASELAGNARDLDALMPDIVARARQLIAREEPVDPVDEASVESFPASDPPGWIGHGSPGW